MKLSERLDELASEARTAARETLLGTYYEAQARAFERAAQLAGAHERDLATPKPLDAVGVGHEHGRIIVQLGEATVRLPAIGARQLVAAINDAIIELVACAVSQPDVMPHDPEELQ